MATRIKNRDIPLFKKKMLLEQDGKCLLCGRDLRKIDISNIVLDHDHTTGIIRGALCRLCNGHEGRVKKLATMCTDGSRYKEWIKNLNDYLSGETGTEKVYLHPTFKTEREKRDSKNKKARAAYQRKKRKVVKPNKSVSHARRSEITFKVVG